ncbi:MAG: carboxypeptidase-like regulatory domain-containing protein [Pyrinomonadaceae bacterium]
MKRRNLALFAVIAASLFAGCTSSTTGSAEPTNSETGKTSKSPKTLKVKDGYVVSEDGTAKEKPETGKANVQGTVLYNEKPVPDIEVQLCENFSRFSGCSGTEFKTKTDKNGEYLFKNVDPKDYQGLLARVFDTDSFVFAAQSFGLFAAKYKIEPDMTFFAPATNLFKADLKIENLKKGDKIEARGFELKWEKYPDAAYYKFSLFPYDRDAASPYIDQKTEGESFKFEKQLEPGNYRLKFEAYNSNDVKLSVLKEEMLFTVNGNIEKTETKE